MGNVRFPQYRTKKRADRDLLRGWQLGAWTVISLFMDKYDVSDEEAVDLLVESHELLIAFGTKQLKPETIFKELQERTGIEFQQID